MIESYLTQNMLTRGETAIGDYLRTGQSDYSNLIQESFTDLIRDLIDANYEVRRLCKRLDVEASGVKTATFTGTSTEEDFGQRMRLVIDVTACTDPFIFVLKGTDDEGTNYEIISIIPDSGTADTSLTIADAGKTSYLLTRLFKKYRLDIITAGTTITYSAYLIEEVYTSMHRDKTRANIYRSLMTTSAEYIEKYNMYEEKYQKQLATAKKIFDVGDDNKISESEGEQEVQNIIFH